MCYDSRSAAVWLHYIILGRQQIIYIIFRKAILGRKFFSCTYSSPWSDRLKLDAILSLQINKLLEIAEHSTRVRSPLSCHNGTERS